MKFSGERETAFKDLSEIRPLGLTGHDHGGRGQEKQNREARHCQFSPRDQ